jgi:hypothetical protein
VTRTIWQECKEGSVRHASELCLCVDRVDKLGWDRAGAGAGADQMLSVSIHFVAVMWQDVGFEASLDTGYQRP